MRFLAVVILLLGVSLAAQSDTSEAERVSARAVQRLRDGRGDEAWTLLRQRVDNTTRSVVIRDIPRMGVSPATVIRRLRTESDVSARRALILVLGGYGAEDISPVQRASVRSLLLQWHERDPDPGIHSAAEWLLRERGYGAAPALSRKAAVADRRWYVTAEGQSMAIVRGPASVRMGSPADEAGRQPATDSAAEPTHTVTIPRSFALATTEVTVAQFQRFLDADPEARRRYQYPDAPTRMADVLARFSPDADAPVIAVTWYEAALYCNWLSAREGLPPSEWVYPAGVLADGMPLPADYLRRSGYRLPTEAEWELAVRAGTSTARFFGASDVFLPEYAWFARHPPKTKSAPVDPQDPQRTSRVARLKPNDLGLFDVYGNVWEWTQDRVERFQTADDREDREDTTLRVSDQDARTRRGGAFPYGAEMARSAGRGPVTSLPTNRRDNLGFRIARTMR